MSGRCLVVTADLMGYSHLAGIVRSAGLEPVQVRGPAGIASATLDDVRATLVDLFDPQGGPDAVRAAVARHLPVIAVGPHVRQDLFDAARDAGASDVLPHSAVPTRLGPLLQGLAAQGTDHDPGAHS